MHQLLYAETQVCQAYQLSRSTLRRKMAEGAIVPVRIGRSIRFVAADVQAFVARLSEEAQAGKSKETAVQKKTAAADKHRPAGQAKEPGAA